VFNGDTMDTRPGPLPDHTAECRAAVDEMHRRASAPLTFLTGNHDPDVSPHHAWTLAGGRVFVVHGDTLFDDIVPWGRDATYIRGAIARHTAPRTPAEVPLAERFAIWRQVAGSIPQRHQSEQNLLKYAVRFVADTVWPPNRFLQIFRAWRQEPELAARMIPPHQPQAGFVVLGHTHRPLVRRLPSGLVVINTGSFTAPFGGYAVDVGDDRLSVRRVAYRGGEFVADNVVAEFPLAKS
jgi:predicted phosphodiesterase